MTVDGTGRDGGAFDARDELDEPRELLTHFDSKAGYVQALESLQARYKTYGLVYICISSFDKIEQRYGHDVSHRLVSVIAKRLKRCVREEDEAFIVKDGEFVIVCKSAYEIGVYRGLRDRIKNALESDVILAGSTIRVNVGFGYAHYPEDGLTPEQTIAHARENMARNNKSQRRADMLERAIDEGLASPARSSRVNSFEGLMVDELTGLPDAVYFRRKASELLNDTEQRKSNLAVVFCDIEKFKTYNLKYGYRSGDDLLKYVADTLEHIFVGDLVARLSNDRYGIVTVMDGLPEKLQIAHDAVRSYKIDSNIEFKAGAFEVAEDDFNAATAQDYAHLACDSIKGRYDKVWRLFDEDLEREVVLRQYIVDNLEAAMANDWIEVYFQPIYRALSRQACGMEALVRWNDPEYGMLNPGQFIEVLEDAHLINKLDMHVVRKACIQGRRIMDEGHAPDLSVSVNLSRLDYQLCDIFSTVEEAIEASGFPRKNLHLEITETAFLQDAEYLRGVVDEFRNAGYQVWMDDFGSGYSSLNLLKDFNFDVLKIDIEFLRGLEESARTRDIIESVVDMTKKLGIQTLAEGVETEGQFEFLKSIGCEIVQGFLFSRPLPMPELEAALVSGKIEIEDEQTRAYLNDVGKINVLSPSPFDFGSDHDDASLNSSDIPLAVVEKCGTELRRLLSSSAFDETIKSSQFIERVDPTILFNDRGENLKRELTLLSERADKTGREETTDFYDFKDAYTLRLRHISRAGDRDAYLIALSRYEGGNIQRSHYSHGPMVYLPEAQSTPWQSSSEIDLEHTALIVVDVNGGSSGVTPGLEDMAFNCVRLAKAARAVDVPVVFSVDNHIPGLDRELELWGDHGLKGTEGGTPIAEFEVCDSDFVVPKRRYNGFYETDLELTLDELGVTTLVFVGCDTNICVLQTLAGAYFLGYKTIVAADATATFLVGNQSDGLDYFRRCYDTRIMTTDEILERFSAGK